MEAWRISPRADGGGRSVIAEGAIFLVAWEGDVWFRGVAEGLVLLQSFRARFRNQSYYFGVVLAKSRREKSKH